MDNPQASDSQNTEHSRITTALPASPHALCGDVIIKKFNSTRQGITAKEADSRLQQYGLNSLPRARPSALGMIFLSQFVSPLIYVLVASAIFSVVIREWSDAAFITGVLLINAIIGNTGILRPASSYRLAATRYYTKPRIA